MMLKNLSNLFNLQIAIEFKNQLLMLFNIDIPHINLILL